MFITRNDFTSDIYVLLLSELEYFVIKNGNNKNKCKCNTINTQPEGVEKLHVDSTSTNEWKKWVLQVKHKPFTSAHAIQIHCGGFSLVYRRQPNP